MTALRKDPDPADRLIRYGFSAEERAILNETLHRFRCRDTCGRRRACLEELAKAAKDGDQLAKKLIATEHTDRLMDEASLAYGRRIGRIFC